MNKIARYAGYAWAFPVTFFGLVYAVLFWKLGWLTWRGVTGDGLVWILNAAKAPTWLNNLWKGWAGHCIGNVVVLKQDPTDRPQTLTHELKHASQCMRLGVFQPIVYAICYLAIKMGCPGSDPYYDNCMEIDARRAAGQVIDVVGALKKINEKIASGEIKMSGSGKSLTSDQKK